MNSITSNSSLDIYNLNLPKDKSLTFDIMDKDYFTKKTFAELIQSQMEKHLPYILSETKSWGKFFCFDALNLRKWNGEHSTHPVTDKKLSKIFFFAITQPAYDSFKYLGHSEETCGRKDFIDSFFDAAENDTDAMCMLGAFCDEDCFGIEEDPEEALRWWTLSAEKGDSNAQMKLGDLYEDGYIVKRNLRKAYNFLKMASDQGNTHAKFQLKSTLYDLMREDSKYAETIECWKQTVKQSWAIEPFTDMTFIELIEKQKKKNLPYILAVAHDSNFTPRFFDALALSKNVYQVHEFVFFSIDHPQTDDEFFTYLGSSKDKNEKKLFIDTFIKAAENDPQAMCDLGILFYKGSGVKQNHEEAFKWLKLSAKLRNAQAQYEVGNCYSLGYGIEENPDKAYKWFKLSAEQGYPDGQTSLGCCYYDATGVLYNFKQAKKWWKLAAEQGKRDALDALLYSEDYVKIEKKQIKYIANEIEKNQTLLDAQNYGNKYDVNLSNEENLKLQQLMRDSGNGDADAQFNLGCYYDDQIQETLKWWKIAADQGQIDAQYNLSICRAQGLGIPQDLKKAVKWCKFAALQGDADAQFELANFYFEGKGVEKDIKKAIKWWSLAKEQGHEDAQYNLSVCEENSGLVKQYLRDVKKQKRLDNILEEYQYYYDDPDLSKTKNLKIKQLLLSAGNGDVNALFKLASSYFEMAKSEPSYLSEAIMPWKLTAEQGDSDSQYIIGVCYAQGYGVKQNLEKAKEWLTPSAQQGDIDAKKYLAELELS